MHQQVILKSPQRRAQRCRNKKDLCSRVPLQTDCVSTTILPPPLVAPVLTLDIRLGWTSTVLMDTSKNRFSVNWHTTVSISPT